MSEPLTTEELIRIAKALRDHAPTDPSFLYVPSWVEVRCNHEGTTAQHVVDSLRQYGFPVTKVEIINEAVI